MKSQKKSAVVRSSQHTATQGKFDLHSIATSTDPHEQSAYEQMLPLALALDPKELIQINLDPGTVATTCLGVAQRLITYQRLEAACKRALVVRALSYRHIESILKHGLDRAPSPDMGSHDANAIVHENIRGRGYYQ